MVPNRNLVLLINSLGWQNSLYYKLSFYSPARRKPLYSWFYDYYMRTPHAEGANNTQPIQELLLFLPILVEKASAGPV